MINCMVIVKRVQGAASRDSIVGQKFIKQGGAKQQKRGLEAEETKAATEEGSQDASEDVTESENESDTVTESENEEDEDAENADEMERIKLAIETQFSIIRKDIQKIDPPRLFTGIDEFQREVVDKLNAVTKELGLPDYFSHNGLDKP